MKREDRQHAIVDLLVAHGAVDLEDLSHRFAVSKMTVYRDLDDLEEAGLVRKIRGGATVEPGTQFESDFRFRERQGLAAKGAIARHALRYVEPGMTVLINDGSTAAVLGKAVAHSRPLTVVTNNAAIVEALKDRSGITLMALGGVYSKKYNGFFGKLTEDALIGLRADIAFLSAPAVKGCEVFHMDEAVVRTKRAMMAAASKSCLLVNHTRMDAQALHRFAGLDEFEAIITDARPPDAVMQSLGDAGISLEIAEGKEH